MNADGTGQANLTNNPKGDYLSLWASAWSPDGSQILFESEDGQIYVMNADGTGQTNLSNDPGKDFTPAWSP